MEARIDAALAEFSGLETRIPAARLRAWIESCPLSLDHVARYCRYHPEHYVRNLMRGGPAYHALVLCWRNGHRSPIHDHSGSGCAVKVLAGEAIETTFQTAPNGMAYAVGSKVLAEGSTCYTEDRDIHQVSNLQPAGADLVTLHVYSPPLLRMNVYSLHGRAVREFFDPVNDEFTSGAGI